MIYAARASVGRVDCDGSHFFSPQNSGVFMQIDVVFWVSGILQHAAERLRPITGTILAILDSHHK
jgi:hypothetical protein